MTDTTARALEALHSIIAIDWDCSNRDLADWVRDNYETIRQALTAQLEANNPVQGATSTINVVNNECKSRDGGQLEAQKPHCWRCEGTGTYGGPESPDDHVCNPCPAPKREYTDKGYLLVEQKVDVQKLSEMQMLRLKEIVIPNCNRDPSITISATIEFMYNNGWLNIKSIINSLIKGETR